MQMPRARPWSPEPFNPNDVGQGNIESYLETRHLRPQDHRLRRREPSDEAYEEPLDIVDYAGFRARDDISARRQLLQSPAPISGHTRSQAAHPESLRSFSPPAHSPHYGASSQELPSFFAPKNNSSYSSHRPDAPGTPTIDRLPVHDESHDLGADAELSHFPAWSRGWYDTERKRAKRAASGRDFNAVLPTHPWHDDDGVDPDLPPSVKAERLRMLEQEFGSGPANRAKGGEGGTQASPAGPTAVGAVDGQGYLITAGPRKRLALRVAQGSLALISAISSIYAAVGIHTPTPPPPSSKAPAIVLYALSVLSFLLTLYLFLFRRYCCTGRRNKSNNGGLPSGMMVLPVMQGKDGKKKKKGKGGPGQDVHVNLIVDPAMFGGRGNPAGDNESERGRPNAGLGDGRLSAFAAIANEDAWRAARSYIKRILFVDILCMILWGGEFILIVIGKKCPAGGFNGWCNAYNLATACACFLFFAFAGSVFFNIRDLMMSRVNPRTRT
ncbi:hypothetical protein BOTBODRAFT_34541 [Botryobasidium botryosum FD-172 SS1]|uniref:Uncharacterized protein n=1 Tax=Botryobasidium botryosum (strain FD-172 SS1) TaxID=930990 RepID=A0A067MK63_BOTB1|nr:hypothetical protein BOTBODRAFT_34541 [Botryobasidium botryosum FD-172 SS1]